MTASCVEPETCSIVGRDHEVRSLLAEPTHVVVGEPGIGRTVLLRRLADTADRRVLWVRGRRAESELPFGAAAQLLGGLDFDTVPQPQRRALEVALALSDGPAPSPLAVCAGALGVLVGQREPLLVLVDDLQWVDPESRQLFEYVGQRLAGQPVTLVMGWREEPGDVPDVPDLPALRLAGLDVADCVRLARSCGLLLPDHDIAAAADLTGGNPSALLDSLTGGDMTPSAWHGVLDRLPDATRLALFVLAVAEPAELASLDAALLELGLSLRDLAPAERLRLVTYDQNRLRLCHRLLRRALRTMTPTATRIAAYRALAATAGPELGLWYESLAATGPDEDLARRLVTAARTGRETRLLRRAAELTGSTTSRAARLLAAAKAAVRVGQGERAAIWCQEAKVLRPGSVFRAAVATTYARALVLSGRHREAGDELRAAAAGVALSEPTTAARLLIEATIPALALGEARLAADCAAEAEALHAGIPLPSSARVRIAAARVQHGLPDRAASPDGAAALPSVAELAGDPLVLVQAAAVHLWAERWELARLAISTAIERLRGDTAPALLTVALAVRSDLGYRTGNWVAAAADAAESVRCAQPGHAAAHGLIALARLDAVRGDARLCAQRLAQARRVAGLSGLDPTLGPAVRGLAALGAGEPSAALEPLAAAWTDAVARGVANPNVVPFAGDLAEAHARCGNRESALEVLSWLEDRAVELRLRTPSTTILRCRGLLADDADEAAALFAAAEQACDWTLPFEVGRTLLCEGEVLRRHRRPSASRSVLRRALHVFESLGAAPWADRAEAELSATSDRGATRPAAIETLTPQQLRIAQLVATGRNNVEVAEALFLSRKTVEAHLTQVYRKLGVHSRVQLVNALP